MKKTIGLVGDTISNFRTWKREIRKLSLEIAELLGEYYDNEGVKHMGYTLTDLINLAKATTLTKFQITDIVNLKRWNATNGKTKLGKAFKNSVVAGKVAGVMFAYLATNNHNYYKK